MSAVEAPVRPAPVVSPPLVTPRSPNRRAQRALGRGITALYLVPILALSATVSFINLAGAPQRIDDEGTYTAQAWAIAQFGQLTHYSYWYDHPPLGWMQLAFYTELTGAFSRYPAAVTAAREAVVVASLVSAVLIWAVARRLRLTRPAAGAAVLLFALSPLALQFHRTVYLDNVATPWLLAAVLLVMHRKNQLAAFSAAALCFGTAVLSKETFLLALPILIWLAARSAHRSTRRYTLAVAGTVLALVGGSYVLLAAVKGELLPGRGHSSLITGLSFQLASREGSGSLFDPGSLFSRAVGIWWQLDPVFIVAALLASLVALRVWRLRPLAVLVLGATLFMFRPGGYLPVPYVIMLIPFGALMVAGVADAAVRRIRSRGMSAFSRGRGGVVALTAMLAVVVAAPLWTAQLRGFLFADLDRPMQQAEDWMYQNVPRDTRLLVDDSMWVDLVRAGWNRDDVVWYYKADTDPEVIRQNPRGWRDTDYVISTGSMRTFPDKFPRVQSAIDNSAVVASFGDGAARVDIRRVAHDGLAAQRALDETVVADSKIAGAQIAANAGLEMSASDRDLLTGGRVDPAIAIALGTAVSTGEVTVDGFPIIDGERNGTVRQVSISSLGGDPTVVDGVPSPAVRALVSSLGMFTPQRLAVRGDAVLLTYPVGATPVP